MRFLQLNGTRPLVIFLLAGVALSLSGHLLAQWTESPRNQEAFTGQQLYEAIKHWTPRRKPALAFLEGLYADKIDNGKIPDSLVLGEVFVMFMENNKDKWTEPVVELVIKALKNAPAQIESQKAYWATAYAAAKAYFAQPTPENAAKFLMALPASRLPMFDLEGESRLREYVLDFVGAERTNFGVLDKQLEQANPVAWDICYRLLNISDGAYSETILYGLGTFITINPRLFLQKVIAHQPGSMHYLNNMLRMVAEFGEIPEAGGDSDKYDKIYHDRISERIKALESVPDPDLADLRDACISKLKRGFVTHQGPFI